MEAKSELTPEQARAFIRKIMGRPRRELVGKEKEDILLLLKMVEPFKQTNNQRSWTDYYMIGNREYHVTDFESEVIVELMLEDDDT